MNVRSLLLRLALHLQAGRLCQFSKSAHLQGTHGAFPFPELLGDFLYAEALDEFQDQHVALPLCQLLQSLLELLHLDLQIQFLFNSIVVGDFCRTKLIKWDGGFPGTVMIDDGITSNAVQPCPDRRRPRLVGRQLLPHLDENMGCNSFGRAVIRHAEKDIAIDAIHVAIIQVSERFAISLLGETYQFGFIGYGLRGFAGCEAAVGQGLRLSGRDFGAAIHGCFSDVLILGHGSYAEVSFWWSWLALVGT